MTRGQRFTFLGIAVVIAVVAVILLVGGGDETEKASNPAPTPTPTATAASEGEATETPTPTPTPTATPKPPPLLTAGKVTKLSFDQGDTVRFRVRSDKPEEIHVHGYDITKEVEANKTATVSFKGSITGIFEIEFHGSGTQIGELKVEP